MEFCLKKTKTKQNDEDFFIHECSPLYPWMEKLVGINKVIRIVVCSPQLGEPSTRTRSFCIGLAKSLTWLGPPQDEVQALFDSICSSQVAAAADIYISSTDEEIDMEMRRLAKNQKNHWPQSFNAARNIREGQHDLINDCLPPSKQKNLQKWEVEVAAAQHSQYFSDLDQNRDSKPNFGHPHHMPVSITHGTVYAHHKKRLATTFELLNTLGFDCHGTTGAQSKVLPFLRELPPNQRMQLLGNGMRLPSLWAVYLFMLAHITWTTTATTSVSEMCPARKGGTTFFENMEGLEWSP